LIKVNSLRFAAALLLSVLAGCSVLPRSPEPAPKPAPVTELPPKSEVRPAPPKIALALGGGAARGFAHIGVIKALESHGIVPDMVIGTSSGSLVGALYASGYGGFDLQRTALQLDDTIIADWSLPDRGFIKGEALQNFVNQAVQNRPMEKLNKPFAVVATDLQSGEPVVFRTGNTGMAVRASSSVPGVFQPVTISGREYVDGGLVSPVPVRAARAMGADVDRRVHFQQSAARQDQGQRRCDAADVRHHGAEHCQLRIIRGRYSDSSRYRAHPQHRVRGPAPGDN